MNTGHCDSNEFKWDSDEINDSKEFKLHLIKESNWFNYWLAKSVGQFVFFENFADSEGLIFYIQFFFEMYLKNKLKWGREELIILFEVELELTLNELDWWW